MTKRGPKPTAFPAPEPVAVAPAPEPVAVAPAPEPAPEPATAPSAPEPAPVPKMLHFAYVDRVGDQPYRQDIAVIQVAARVEANGIAVPAKTDILRPDKNGVFHIHESHPNHELRLAQFEAKKARVNKPGEPPRLIGPYDSVPEVLKARYEVRPKTAEEAADAERQKRIAAQNENATLKERIAALEKQSAGKD